MPVRILALYAIRKWIIIKVLYLIKYLSLNRFIYLILRNVHRYIVHAIIEVNCFMQFLEMYSINESCIFTV